MKILQEEKKETLPLDFITSFVSKSWDEVSALTATIDDLKKEFTETRKVEEILSSLKDAYLICIGQLEAVLSKKDFTIPSEAVKEEAKAEEDNKELKEDINITISAEDDDKVDSDVKAKEIAPEVDVNKEECAEDTCEETSCEDVICDGACEDTACVKDPFEFFCDFDAPSATPITDDDIYGAVNPLDIEK